MPEDEPTPGEEENEDVETESTSCPFCDGDVQEVSRVGQREGPTVFDDVIRRCATCGFEARFREPIVAEPDA